MARPMKPAWELADRRPSRLFRSDRRFFPDASWVACGRILFGTPADKTYACSQECADAYYAERAGRTR